MPWLPRHFELGKAQEQELAYRGTIQELQLLDLPGPAAEGRSFWPLLAIVQPESRSSPISFRRRKGKKQRRMAAMKA